MSRWKKQGSEPEDEYQPKQVEMSEAERKAEEAEKAQLLADLTATRPASRW